MEPTLHTYRAAFTDGERLPILAPTLNDAYNEARSMGGDIDHVIRTCCKGLRSDHTRKKVRK